MVTWWPSRASARAIRTRAVTPPPTPRPGPPPPPPPPLEPPGPLTHRSNQRRVVRDEQDTRPLPTELGHPFAAPLLEVHVADGQHFVDQQNRRQPRGRHSEGQAGDHPGRIPGQRRVDELPQ